MLRGVCRMFLLVAGTLVIGLSAIGAYLYFAQEKAIYFPRSYDLQPEQVLSLDVRKGWVSHVLSFQTSQGQQRAVYFGKEKPGKLWMMFGGNGAQALDWLDLTFQVPKEGDIGFLMVDYPGYGWCEGNPDPITIQENVSGALTSLAKEWEVGEKELQGKLSLIGHSIGAAVALEAAVNLEVREVVVVSPFTSLQEMANRAVGKPLSLLLRHRYDNVVSLERLQQMDGVKVVMFHGRNDRIIPVSMGRTLGKRFSDFVDFHEVEGAGHNDIFGFIGDDLVKVMARAEPP